MESRLGIGNTFPAGAEYIPHHVGGLPRLHLTPVCKSAHQWWQGGPQLFGITIEDYERLRAGLLI